VETVSSGTPGHSDMQSSDVNFPIIDTNHTMRVNIEHARGDACGCVGTAPGGGGGGCAKGVKVSASHHRCC